MVIPWSNGLQGTRGDKISADYRRLDSLERGEPMPTIAVAALQEAIDAVPEDFEANFKRLEELYARFVERLCTATLAT